MKKHLLLIITSLFLLFSCQDDNNSVESKNNFTVQEIGKGVRLGHFLTQQNTVITNSAQWNTFLTEIDSSSNFSSTFTETNIDFNQFMLIAVVDEVRTSGGYTIDIISVTETTQNIEVVVDNLQKGNFTTIITQPFHIVKIPKIAKPVVFN